MTTIITTTDMAAAAVYAAAPGINFTETSP